jgi:hypothetical protein
MCSQKKSRKRKSESKSLEEEAEEHRQRLARIQKSNEYDWAGWDFKTEFLKLPHVPPHLEYGKANLQKATTKLEIFLRILPPDLLTAIWQSFDRSHWIVSHSSNCYLLSKGEVNLKLYYLYFATYIRICGLQNEPKENEPGKRALRENIKESIAHFNSLREGITTTQLWKMHGLNY